MLCTFLSPVESSQHLRLKIFWKLQIDRISFYKFTKTIWIIKFFSFFHHRIRYTTETLIPMKFSSIFHEFKLNPVSRNALRKSTDINSNEFRLIIPRTSRVTRSNESLKIVHSLSSIIRQTRYSKSKSKRSRPLLSPRSKERVISILARFAGEKY